MVETAEKIEQVAQSEVAKEEQTQQQPQGEPFEIAVLPLQNTTLFPETIVPLAVGRPRSIAAVESALATEEKFLACVTLRKQDVTGQDATQADLFDVGTLVIIKRMERMDDALHMVVQGTER